MTEHIKGQYEKLALDKVESALKNLRDRVSHRKFDPNLPAEVEINKFFFNGDIVDRIMVVLRATGCEAYKTTQGCSMCAHYDGTSETPITSEQYLNQWKNVISGKAFQSSKNFDINIYPILCLYNLGSFLNPNEVPMDAARDIFKSINDFEGIKKTIIESRPEYISSESVRNISEVYGGIIEVGIGLESKNQTIRELCHHKGMPDLKLFEEAVYTLKSNGAKALAYVNQKPPFITEREAIDDAVETAVYAFNLGMDAVSIEPTSLQNNSLTDHLYQIGHYRVPWLWSVIETAKGIHERVNPSNEDFLDLRIGGYFDEEILSGSQGTAPGVDRNELFPHQTAGNCSECTPRVINSIKEFNRTYDLDQLMNIDKCKTCYPVWESSLKISDSRTIPRRIIDTI